MQRSNFAPWVRGAIGHAKIAQAELARKLTTELERSIDRAAINKMLKGERRVAVDEMKAIAKITGFAMPIGDDTIRYIPEIEWVNAGALAAPSSQIPVDDVPLLAYADLGRGDFFALKVRGDSMDRLSPEGSTIVVNRADQQLVSGKPYVFSLKGATTYKLWHADPPYLQPFSTNPAHTPEFFKKKELAVVGRVRRTVLDL